MKTQFFVLQLRVTSLPSRRWTAHIPPSAAQFVSPRTIGYPRPEWWYCEKQQFKNLPRLWKSITISGKHNILEGDLTGSFGVSVCVFPLSLLKHSGCSAVRGCGGGRTPWSCRGGCRGGCVSRREVRGSPFPATGQTEDPVVCLCWGSCYHTAPALTHGTGEEQWAIKMKSQHLLVMLLERGQRGRHPGVSEAWWATRRWKTSPNWE